MDGGGGRLVELLVDLCDQLELGQRRAKEALLEVHMCDAQLHGGTGDGRPPPATERAAVPPLPAAGGPREAPRVRTPAGCSPSGPPACGCSPGSSGPAGPRSDAAAAPRAPAAAAEIRRKLRALAAEHISEEPSVSSASNGAAATPGEARPAGSAANHRRLGHQWTALRRPPPPPAGRSAPRAQRRVTVDARRS
ncbi:unnamed protein product [Prorocentrum cordatum]|uniref:Uncharacterized protein n=1 Tax=Prorocentrum cordatum TaxID=2364126 RepID=A0ABN9W7Z5_9DINO|nr:unnamed protein product [Polarella glacialis]